MKSIRGAYEERGVESFYRERGHLYQNPHTAQIDALLSRYAERITGARILDVCCGSGEVTRAALSLGALEVVGVDPYTYAAYERQTGLVCLRYSFAELIRGALDDASMSLDNATGCAPTSRDVPASRYDLIICSFAMHLCPQDQLYALVYTLFKYSETLMIITPHKRPELEKLSGVLLCESAVELTPKGKRVTLKRYAMPHHPERGLIGGAP